MGLRFGHFILAGMALSVLAAGPAGATVITGFQVDFSADEQSAFNGVVAFFSDDNPAATNADFTATIDWGDGSPTTSGTIVDSSGEFGVLGQHTYADEGSFTATVTIADVSPGTGTATVTDTATVNEADVLAGSGVSFSAPVGVGFTTAVANFTDTLTTAAVSDFTATINWGDATTSAGTVSGGGGAFQVSGTHTYAASGTFTVVVTLSDDAPGTASAQATSTANVAGGLSVTAVSFTVAEAASFNGTVATFSDPNGQPPSSFTATINWGDGTPLTAGTITGGGGVFSVSGQHTYADEGSFTTTVAVTESGPGGKTASSSGTATVTEADVLSAMPVTIAPQMNAAFSGVVANFSDTDAANVPGDFAATINWGDGSPATAGTVSGGGGAFAVSGTHTYTTTGTFTVTVTLAEDAPGTATATAVGTANVSAALVAVPTLDPRGLLALALALGLAGFYLLRRRAA